MMHIQEHVDDEKADIWIIWIYDVHPHEGLKQHLVGRASGI
jgi:hypothetical protein